MTRKKITNCADGCELDLLCDLFTTYTNIKSLCCTPEDNIIYMSIVPQLKEKNQRRKAMTFLRGQRLPQRGDM